MAERQSRPVFAKPRFAVATVAVAVALAAGVYVTLTGQGNVGPGGSAETASCAAAKPLAASLDPLIGGEIAAFRAADKPDLMSELAFDGADGKPTTLAAFKGKVALVNLWATWCAPCRQEMPSLDRLEQALGGEDFAVVPVSIDIGGRDRPAAFLEQIGVKSLPLYTDESTAIFEGLKKRGLALGLPVTVLVDRNGCRLGSINGPAEWDSDDAKRLIEAAIKGEATPSS